MQIALFGGSFDPPHLGHLFAALHARVVGGADEVWILPVARHPYEKALQAWERRWQLCRCAFAELPFVRLRDDELRNPQGHSIDLVEDLCRRFPDKQWMLVGGSDTADDLPHWKRGEELAALLRIHVVPRGGYDDDPAALPPISSQLIRQRLAAGLSIQGLVPLAVEQLLSQQGWYASCGNSPQLDLGQP